MYLTGAFSKSYFVVLLPNLRRSLDHAELAVGRVPVDIWENIFIYSISYPFLPSSNDSLLRETQLLDHNCEAHRQPKQIWARMRLVCIFWNEILKNISVSSLYWGGSATSLILRSALRVDIKEYGYMCPFMNSVNSGENEEKTMDKSSCQLVEALVGLNTFRDPPDLAKFPNVRLIATYNFASRHISSKYPALIHNLTHLRVPVIYSDRLPSNRPIFTNLRTLCIDFSGEIDYREFEDDGYFDATLDDLDFLDWSLPRLVNLGCFGETWQNWADQAIYELIERFGSALKGVYLAVYEERFVYRSYKSSPKNLWRRFSHMETIYTSLTNFSVENKPPDGHSPLTVVLCDVDARSVWQEESDNLDDKSGGNDYSISKYPPKVQGWSAGDLQMDLSWDSLKIRVDRGSYNDLYRLYSLLNQLKNVGRDLKDKNGEGMETEQGKKFILWMETTRQELKRTLG
jgi:hypothetical protein